MATGAIKRWLNLTTEEAILKEWPNLLEKHGLDAIAAWRNEGNKHKPAVVHMLAQRGKVQALLRHIRLNCLGGPVLPVNLFTGNRDNTTFTVFLRNN